MAASDRADTSEEPGLPVRADQTRAATSLRPGTLVFGLSVSALGLLGLYRGDFTVVFHPMPETLPARFALASLSSVLLFLGGLGIQVPRFRKAGGLLLAGLFLLLGAQWLIRVLSFPEMIGTWVGWSEQLALALGGVMAALQSGEPGRRATHACRIAFGLFQLIFGLGHFLSFPETVAMTPGWLPPGPEFWALATGIVHFAGGVAFLIGFRASAVAAVLAAMFASFALLVWLPAVLAAPTAPVPPAGLIVTIALTGSMLLLFDLLRIGQAGPAGSEPSAG